METTFQIGINNPYQLGMVIFIALGFAFLIYYMTFLPEWPEKLIARLLGRKKKA